MSMNIHSDRGVALVIAVMATLLLMALGIAVLLAATTETLIATGFGRGHEAVYAADAIVERGLDDLQSVGDWNRVLDGSVRSSFVDGAAAGGRGLGDGAVVDVAQVANLANCQKTSPCTGAEMNQITTERPWAANNPRWTPYAYGYLRDLLPPGSIDSPLYVVLLVGDDPAENDNDPATDGADPLNPGSGRIALRAEAFGPRGAHKVVEATIARTAAPDSDRVQIPGQSLAEQRLSLASGGVR